MKLMAVYDEVIINPFCNTKCLRIESSDLHHHM